MPNDSTSWPSVSNSSVILLRALVIRTPVLLKPSLLATSTIKSSRGTPKFALAIELALRRNSGRSETLHTRPEREYLLKGLIRCIYCGMPMWAQTLKSGNPYYREQSRSRSHMDCPGDGKSIRWEVPDDQIGRIVGAVILPEAWLDRVLAQVHLADEVKRINEERKEVERRLKRLGQVYLDNLITVEEYHRQKRLLEDKMASLVIPAVDATEEAGKLLENLPGLWDKATTGERRRILLTMLDAVYVEAIEAKAIVVIRPKPAFMPLFEMATTRDGSEVILIKEKPPGGPEATDPCFWWRRGRVELPVQKVLRSNMLQACPALYICSSKASAGGISREPADFLKPPLSASGQMRPRFMAPVSPPPGLVRADVAAY